MSGAHKTALGYGLASTIFSTLPSTFSGQTVTSSSLLIRYTYLGDANLDGTVNALDFNALASNFGSSGVPWTSGDFNYDGTVNTLDFSALAANFGSTLGVPALGGLVPEPSGILALLAGGVLASHRRNQSRRTRLVQNKA